jgi:hypothetical protein
MTETTRNVFFCDILPCNVADLALKLEAAMFLNIRTYGPSYMEVKNVLCNFQFYQCTVCEQTKHLAHK